MRVNNVRGAACGSSLCGVWRYCRCSCSRAFSAAISACVGRIIAPVFSRRILALNTWRYGSNTSACSSSASSCPRFRMRKPSLRQQTITEILRSAACCTHLPPPRLVQGLCALGAGEGGVLPNRTSGEYSVPVTSAVCQQSYPYRYCNERTAYCMLATSSGQGNVHRDLG